MPNIKIDLYEGRSPEQKAQLAEAVMKAFVDILGSSPADISLVFNNIKRSDWHFGQNVYSLAK
ncbi:4-oxalocrotonate tautomerase [compost metagenome]